MRGFYRDCFSTSFEPEILITIFSALGKKVNPKNFFGSSFKKGAACRYSFFASILQPVSVFGEEAGCLYL
jgi:hypothetical protein